MRIKDAYSVRKEEYQIVLVKIKQNGELEWLNGDFEVMVYTACIHFLLFIC